MNGSRCNRPLAVLIVALVAADWLTKLWITDKLALGDNLALIEEWFYFIPRHNPGVAFGMLAGLPDSFRVPLLTALGFLGVVLFTRVLLSSKDRWTQLSAATVIGGAIGNMGERLFSGGVTDFLFLPFFPFVFNLADTAITLGGTVLAYRLMREVESAPAAATAEASAV